MYDRHEEYIGCVRCGKATNWRVCNVLPLCWPCYETLVGEHLTHKQPGRLTFMPSMQDNLLILKLRFMELVLRHITQTTNDMHTIRHAECLISQVTDQMEEESNESGARTE